MKTQRFRSSCINYFHVAVYAASCFSFQHSAFSFSNFPFVESDVNEREKNLLRTKIDVFVEILLTMLDER